MKLIELQEAEPDLTHENRRDRRRRRMVINCRTGHYGRKLKKTSRNPEFCEQKVV